MPRIWGVSVCTTVCCILRMPSARTVSPWPVPAPLPRRFVCFIAPAAGWMFPSLMTSVLLDRHQVADLEDHAPDLGRVGVHHGVLHLADAERAHGGTLVLRMPA